MPRPCISLENSFCHAYIRYSLSYPCRQQPFLLLQHPFLWSWWMQTCAAQIHPKYHCKDHFPNLVALTMSLFFCILVSSLLLAHICPCLKALYNLSLIKKSILPATGNPNLVNCNQRRSRTFVAHRDQWLQWPSTTRMRTPRLGDLGKVQGKNSQISLEQVEAVELSCREWGGRLIIKQSGKPCVCRERGWAGRGRALGLIKPGPEG